MSNTPSLPHGIGFLGGGNMAEAIMAGLIANGMPPARIHVGEPREERCRELHAKHGIVATPDNHAVIAAGDVLLLAVKPQVLGDILSGLAPDLKAHRPMLISIAAGIPVAKLQGWADCDVPIVRCMPNTPALVGAGVSGLFADASLSEAQRATASRIMQAVGPVHWLPEEPLIDALTAISGSGPAYFFAFVEHLTKAGTELGLSEELSAALARQTAWGAAKLMQETDTPAATLRAQVTSPGGATQAALEAFNAGDFAGLVQSATRACMRRAQELGG